MNLFFDTEFTGLHKDTTLISLGIVSENGKRFYAECTDFEEKQCDEWIENNVLKHLILSGNETLAKELGEDNETTVVLGSKNDVARELSEWLSQFDSLQFVSDVCHYDMVLLIDLFGNAFDLPQNVSAVCHDINADIAKHYGISEKEAFDKSREEIVSELCKENIKGNKHNSLYDAEVIKCIYKEV